ncbi:hypothetical protein B0H14DRAFT_2567198 [Mycena olivaceomarginata]|nr:hypothetical protein B0H14DRAFT_2567198 [Mycena olivaceomarginata]
MMLTEYFATATPRIDDTVVHSFPAPDCEEPDCLGESSPLVLETIETVWPKILHINPYTGTQDPLLHTKVFTIDDGQGGLIVYELIGTISHDAEKLHWTSKLLIEDITFSYDELARGGSLVAQGPGDVIIEPDRTAVWWVYHRSTDIMESQKKLPEIETTYEIALQKDLKRPKTPPIVVDTPSSEPPESSDTVNEMIIDSISSPATNAPPQSQDLFFTPDQSPAPPLAGEVSFAETNSQTLCPFWCHGCRVQDPEGDGIFEEVQCERCRNWSHMACLPSGVDWGR